MLGIIVNIFLIIMGIYTIYSTNRVRKNGVIPSSNLTFSCIEKMKDNEEYKKYYIKLNYTIGFLLIIEGIIFIIDKYYNLPEVLIAILLFLCFIYMFTIIWKTFSFLPSHKNKNS